MPGVFLSRKIDFSNAFSQSPPPAMKLNLAFLTFLEFLKDARIQAIQARL